MNMYIADTHFGHENVIKQCRPQFASIEEMANTLIENINSKMSKNDTLYIVGDFAYRSKTPVIGFLQAIKPKKILIKGNHDHDWLHRLSTEELDRCFVGIYSQFSFKKNGIEVHLNHFPQLAWNKSHYFAQSFSVCGHIHNEKNATLAARLFPQVKCQFNAGVDVNGYMPVTFAELVQNNLAFYKPDYTEQELEMLYTAVQKINA